MFSIIRGKIPGQWFFTIGRPFHATRSPVTYPGRSADEKSLKNAGVYIIVDPDTTRENPSPNYVTDKDVRTIFRWVKKGGVLLLMSNDGPNAEFTHFNRLAGAFGFTFHPLTLNPVTGRNWEMGAETNFPDHPLFKGVSKIYMKEVAPITLAGKASSVLKMMTVPFSLPRPISEKDMSWLWVIPGFTTNTSVTAG